MDDQKNIGASPGLIESIWNRHSRQIYKLCQQKCGNVEDAKDLFQTVALKFCQNASSLRSESSAFPWLVAIMHNAHVDFVRKNCHYVKRNACDENLADFSMVAAEKTAFYFPENQACAQLEKLLEGLNEFEKSLVDLSIVGGLTLKELGPVYGLSENALVKRRQKALKKLGLRIKNAP